MSLPGSRDSPDWGQPEVDTQKQLGLSGLGTLMEKLQHPKNSMCLLYPVEQRGRVISYS